MQIIIEILDFDQARVITEEENSSLGLEKLGEGGKFLLMVNEKPYTFTIHGRTQDEKGIYFSVDFDPTILADVELECAAISDVLNDDSWFELEEGDKDMEDEELVVSNNGTHGVTADDFQEE